MLIDTYQEAKRLIKRFEGLSLKRYICPAGYPTIGWGRRLWDNTIQIITLEQAERYLDEDVQKSYSAIASMTKVSLSQLELAALISFVHNFGAEAFRTSTLLKLLNQKLHSHAAAEFDKWVHARDRRTKKMVRMEGLVKRRAAERAVFEIGLGGR